MNKLFVLLNDCTDPYYNLALEQTLLESVGEDERILYLWQNRHTVVIGRNQNAVSECRIQKLESDGGFLARRLSGGGAVYHDLGNLNFTFITGGKLFDKEKQTEVILRAVRKAGINAEKNGRNDLTADGRKFSGHAYYKSKNSCYHHGTIMLDVDMSRLSVYLNVSPMKLEAKGVASVKSRVINLRELNPGLDRESMRSFLIEAFAEVYGGEICFIDIKDIDGEKLELLRRRYESPEWKYGGVNILDNSVEKRFSWGQARIDFSISDGCLSDVCFYSDGLEADFIALVPEKLKGCEANAQSMLSALLREGEQSSEVTEMAEDIISMITELIK